jgi:hypothetical protein
MNILYILAALDATVLGIPKVNGGAGALNVIFGIVYAVIGTMAVFYIIRAGLLFVTSGSDPSAIKAAKETILYAVVALVGSTMIFTIISFVVSNLGGKG